MTYEVRYKKVNSLFWTKLSGVVGDAFIDEASCKIRVFFLKTNERIEIPMENIIFKFSKERFESIQEKMNSEAGQQMPTKRLG